MVEQCKHSGISGRSTQECDIGWVRRRVWELRVKKHYHLLILHIVYVLSHLILTATPLFIIFKTVFQNFE